MSTVNEAKARGGEKRPADDPIELAPGVTVEDGIIVCRGIYVGREDDTGPYVSLNAGDESASVSVYTPGFDVSLMAGTDGRAHVQARNDDSEAVVYGFGDGTRDYGVRTLRAEDRIAELESEVAELRAYLPMLARLAFFEQYSGESIPDELLRIESWVRLDREDHEHRNDWAPEFSRPRDEALSAGARALRHAYNRRTSPGLVA